MEDSVRSTATRLVSTLPGADREAERAASELLPILIDDARRRGAQKRGGAYARAWLRRELFGEEDQ